MKAVQFDVDRRRVIGLTSIDGISLFVLHSPSYRHIEVCDTKTFKSNKCLKLAGLSDNMYNGLTSCVASNCLYVNDFERSVVYKVELARGDKVSKWSVGGGPSGLSVNTEHNLLVTCFLEGKLEMYTPMGSLIKEVCLERKIRHALQLSSIRYVVCEWFPDCDVYDLNTQIRKAMSYNKIQQSTTQNHFSDPRQLAMDGKNLYVFVADCENNRIVMLHRSSKRANEMIASVNGRRLYRPCCLHLDETNNRLYVGEDVEGGRIFVFDIRRN